MKRFWLRLSKREKSIVFLLLALFVLVLARYLVVNPILAGRARVNGQLELQSQRLENHIRYVGRKEALDRETRLLETRLRGLESSLFKGDTPPVTASALQEMVRALAAKGGAQIVATRVLAPQPAGPFLEVPIKVEVNGDIEQIASLLREIDAGPKLLVVSEIAIRSLRPRVRGRRQLDPLAGAGLRASLVVAALSRLSESPEF